MGRQFSQLGSAESGNPAELKKETGNPAELAIRIGSLQAFAQNTANFCSGSV